jgi:rfaE bifunctional protein nucleotidyltransferase chain/domain
MIVSKEILKNIIIEQKKTKKIVFTNGCFDIIHSGHISYLTEAKKLGDILVLGLNSDDSVRRLKGVNRPVNNENDRAIVLDALKPVDFVAVFSEDTPYNLIAELIPDVIVKGGDYKPDEVVGGSLVTENGGEVAIIDFVDGKSTTNIINKMKK